MRGGKVSEGDGFRVDLGLARSNQGGGPSCALVGGVVSQLDLEALLRRHLLGPLVLVARAVVLLDHEHVVA